MRKLFSTYLTLHPPVSASSSSSSSSSSSYSSTEELRLCYHEVPDVFFRPDFALTTPQTFSVVCGGSNQSGVLLYTIVTLLRVLKPIPSPSIHNVEAKQQVSECVLGHGRSGPAEADLDSLAGLFPHFGRHQRVAGASPEHHRSKSTFFLPFYSNTRK
jgi:hypothetical protein